MLAPSNRYDLWDRLREIEIAAAGLVLRYHYGIRDQIERVEAWGPPAPGADTVLLSELRQAFDERGRRVLVEEGGRRRKFWHERDSRIVAVEDQRGNRNEFELDALGRWLNARDPLGNRIAHIFDATGKLRAIDETELDATGVAVRQYHTELHYDARGRLERVISPAGNITRTKFDDRDLLVAVTTPGGIRHTFDRDLDGLIVLSRLSGGRPPVVLEHRWEYDEAGRLRAYINPEGRVIRYIFGADNRWRRIVYADGGFRERFSTLVAGYGKSYLPSGRPSSSLMGRGAFPSAA